MRRNGQGLDKEASATTVGSRDSAYRSRYLYGPNNNDAHVFAFLPGRLLKHEGLKLYSRGHRGPGQLHM